MVHRKRERFLRCDEASHNTSAIRTLRTVALQWDLINTLAARPLAEKSRACLALRRGSLASRTRSTWQTKTLGPSDGQVLRTETSTTSPRQNYHTLNFRLHRKGARGGGRALRAEALAWNETRDKKRKAEHRVTRNLVHLCLPASLD